MTAVAETLEFTMSERDETAALRRRASLYLVEDADDLALRDRLDSVRAEYRRVVDKTRNSSRRFASACARKYDVLGVTADQKILSDVGQWIENLKAERGQTIEFYRDEGFRRWGQSVAKQKLVEAFCIDVGKFYDQMIEAREVLKRDLTDVLALPAGDGLSFKSARAYFIAYLESLPGVKLADTEAVQDEDDFCVILSLWVPDEVYSNPELLFEAELRAADIVCDRDPDLTGLCAIRYLPKSEMQSNDAG